MHWGKMRRRLKNRKGRKERRKGRLGKKEREECITDSCDDDEWKFKTRKERKGGRQPEGEAWREA